ncbi:MAG TPA: quinoprotein dehydrogenase-associated putative ABC transporter substrate-binding protein [Terriglobales bacterium]
MCSRFRNVVIAIALLCMCVGASAQTELRVCADGDNLPYSNQKQQGLENKIAELLARDMNARLTYYWSRMGRGYIRDVLNAGLCDVLIEIPTDFRHALTTPSFYRSSYVFITRKDRGLNISSLDDERLRSLRVGVQIVAENYSPPGRALGRRGIYSNLVGFEAAGDDAGKIVSAVANGTVDVAIAWGPLAGYYAAKQRIPLRISPVTPEVDGPGMPFTYAISMGVKQGNIALRDRLTQFLERDHEQIEAILRQYNVPLLPLRPTERASADK